MPLALAATFVGVLASGPTLQAGALSPACGQAGAGVGTISIGAPQNGATVCLTIGQKLLVELASPAATGLGWAPVRVSPPGILAKAPSIAMYSRFVTEASFTAKHKGVAELSSQRPTCSAPRGSEDTCEALLHWGARVVVMASHAEGILANSSSRPTPTVGRVGHAGAPPEQPYHEAHLSLTVHTVALGRDRRS